MREVLVGGSVVILVCTQVALASYPQVRVGGLSEGQCAALRDALRVDDPPGCERKLWLPWKFLT